MGTDRMDSDVIHGIVNWAVENDFLLDTGICPVEYRKGNKNKKCDDLYSLNKCVCAHRSNHEIMNAVRAGSSFPKEWMKRHPEDIKTQNYIAK